MLLAVVMFFAVGLAVTVGWVTAREVRRTQVFLWLPGYLSQKRRNRRAQRSSQRDGETHVLFCMVDHFEPISAGSTRDQERSRMRLEMRRRIAPDHAAGAPRKPQVGDQRRGEPHGLVGHDSPDHGTRLERGQQFLDTGKEARMHADGVAVIGEEFVF